ncbi:uncharacterized protein J4E84_002434 [Alternaria hordeiaustralica]|uniref:uncharacterized protein n=1 Tax=Alternaria hordeiaustralica TaxID=1187925 RepID=UPI0020C20E35|nr:uncharacterized protein J4E84_002434 [Alternaria hordeiaustralica]KAI4693858.1 hypothetical protein J4E84_002434 [Alternaria hordeiaustralica]
MLQLDPDFIRMDAEAERAKGFVRCKFNEQIDSIPIYNASPSERQRAVEAATAARKSCRELASEFHAVLPRELRNMIYAYIVGPTAQPQTTPEYSGMWWRVECGKSIRIGWLDSQWGEGIEALDICGESLHMQPKCWAMDPAYFGAHAAQELTETYYSINSFYITSAQEMSNLFRADPFKLGMKPYQFIRKFTLVLNFSGTGMQSEDEVAALHNNLQDLQLLPPKRKHEICIRLETAFQIGEIKLGGYRYRHPYDMEDERVMLNILESIRRPVYDLLHRRKSVRVFQANLEDWCTPRQKTIEDEKEEDADGDPARHYVLRPPNLASDKDKHNTNEDSEEDEEATDEESDEDEEATDEEEGPENESDDADFLFNRDQTLDTETKLKVREALKTRWQESGALDHFWHSGDREGPFGLQKQKSRYSSRDLQYEDFV